MAEHVAPPAAPLPAPNKDVVFFTLGEPLLALGARYEISVRSRIRIGCMGCAEQRDIRGSGGTESLAPIVRG